MRLLFLAAFLGVAAPAQASGIRQLLLSIEAAGVFAPGSMAPALLAATAEEEALIQAVRKAAPSVVMIQAFRDGEKISAGSGVVWDGSHIVTNFHVVDHASSFTVTADDGGQFEAALLGVAKKLDIAVLEVKKLQGARPATLGDSRALQRGQTAITIGSPYAQRGSVSRGIISALGRELTPHAGLHFTDLIQTDAAVNPGSSGGGLFDSSGNLIGLPIAMIALANQVGFALPIHAVQPIIETIIAVGEL